MKKNNLTVFIIDDDQEICESLRWLFESVQFDVETYYSPKDFLENYDEQRNGCIIADVRMPHMSGLELLEHLKLNRITLPVIVITGYGDISMAVRAMKAGAVDFILKPINDQNLLEIIQKNINRRMINISLSNIHERLSHLTAREQQVFVLVAEGNSNKEISKELSIAISTVEAHRAKIMQKLEAKNLADLIKIYLTSQYENLMFNN